jgi:hypothetical protein
MNKEKEKRYTASFVVAMLAIILVAWVWKTTLHTESLDERTEVSTRVAGQPPAHTDAYYKKQITELFQDYRVLRNTRRRWRQTILLMIFL